MSGKPGCGATNLATEQRLLTEKRVIAAMEERGALTIAQIMEITDLSKSTVQNTIKRLKDHGLVKAVGSPKRESKWGHPATLYDLGREEDGPLHKRPPKIVVGRHPHDVAFFGEYERRAA